MDVSRADDPNLTVLIGREQVASDVLRFGTFFIVTIAAEARLDYIYHLSVHCSN